MQIHNIQSFNSNSVMSVTSKQDSSKNQNKLSFKGYLGKNVETTINKLVKNHADCIARNANYWEEPISAADKQSIANAKNLADRVINKMKSFASGLHKDTCLEFLINESYSWGRAYLVLKNEKYNKFLPINNHKATKFDNEPFFHPFDINQYFDVVTDSDRFIKINSVEDLNLLEGIIDELTRFTPEGVNKLMFMEELEKLQDNTSEETKLVKRINIKKIFWGEKLKYCQQNPNYELTSRENSVQTQTKQTNPIKFSYTNKKNCNSNNKVRTNKSFNIRRALEYTGALTSLAIAVINPMCFFPASLAIAGLLYFSVMLDITNKKDKN